MYLARWDKRLACYLDMDLSLVDFARLGGKRIKKQDKPFYYGGQALIEGVMMRGKKYFSVAVRRPDGQIAIKSELLSTFYSHKVRDLPFIRGFLSIIEVLALGTRCLMYSANASQGEEEAIPKQALWFSLAVGVLFAVGLFFVAPLFLINILDKYISSSLISNLSEGLIRLLIFLIYLWLINLIPEVRRVFAYHGAEHMAVNAHESGVPLEVEPVRKYSTAHVRCGTSFLIIVMFVAILVFALLGRPPLWLRFLSRIVLIPLIAAVAYEAIRLGANHTKNIAVKLMLAPGLILQSLTTRIPDDSQLEVAISALKEVIKLDSGDVPALL